MEEVDQRGFSVETEKGKYKMVFRVVEKVFENSFDVFFKTAVVENKGELEFKNLSLGGRLGIKYCPWCGTELKTLSVSGNHV